MAMAPVDDNVSDKKPDQKKKPTLQKPWFNWWSIPNTVSLGPVVIMMVGGDGSASKTSDQRPHPSKDVAETEAQKIIDEHNTNCGCGYDLANQYIGAYEEGTSPP